MKTTIDKILAVIRANKGKDFINVYPYFGVVKDNGNIGERVLIDSNYTYYFDKEDGFLYVENNETGRSRRFSV